MRHPILLDRRYLSLNVANRTATLSSNAAMR